MHCVNEPIYYVNEPDPKDFLQLSNGKSSSASRCIFRGLIFDIFLLNFIGLSSFWEFFIVRLSHLYFHDAFEEPSLMEGKGTREDKY